MTTEQNADSSLRKAAKLVPAALVGGVVGFFGMRFILRAGDSGAALPDHHHTNTVADGVAGMAFVMACLKSGENDGAWTTL